MPKPIVRTKNFTAKPIIGKLTASRYRTVIRFGSTTETSKIFPKGVKLGKKIIEINTVDSIQNSRSKLLMKDCFAKAGVKQANWWTYLNNNNGTHSFLNKEIPLESGEGFSVENLPYPILAKREFGFKGHGMHKFDTPEELTEWLRTANLNGYYFEKFHNYSREYRLHCTKDGCFYTCRKMLKEGAEDRYYRNDSNCVWFLEDNPQFDKPVNWKSIEEDCVKALESTGLTIGAFDVKVQSATRDGQIRTNPEYIIIEVNSAPAFGDITLEKYTEVLNTIIKNNNEQNKTIH